MLRKLMRRVPMSALLVAALVAGCVDQTGLEPGPLSSETLVMSKGGQTDAERDAKNAGQQERKERKAAERQADGSVREWKLVTGTLDTRQQLQARATVDGSKDVFLYAAGHALRIPAGAVREPTSFLLQVFRKDLGDGTVLVGVELKASRLVNGVNVDVGSTGFMKPLTLYVSAHYATPGTDLTNAQILWMVSDTEVRPVTDWTGAGRITTKWGDIFAVDLDHFSSYILGTAW